MPMKQPIPTISVLIPTFNRRQFLGESIRSVVEQTRAPSEIIVLDDGSTDGTADLCKQFGEAIRHIRIQQNAGKTAAINLGLGFARGAFVWIMDDDDIAPPDALETLVAPMLADHSIGFTFGRLKEFTVNAGGELAFRPTEPIPPGPTHLFARLMEDCFITGQSCTLFRRKCLEAVAPFDPSILASVDYNILLQVSRRFRGADVGKVVLWQRQHAGLRGPENYRYEPQDRIERWKSFDKRLIADLLAELSMDEYLDEPPTKGPLSRRQVRQALLQKAVIAARKDLWGAAIESLRDARFAAPGEPLTKADLQTLSRMLGSRYGIDEFLRSFDIQRQLVRSAGGGAAGRQIRTAIASILTYWAGQALRDGKSSHFVLSLVALLRLAGVSGGVQLASHAIAKQLRRALGPKTPAVDNASSGETITVHARERLPHQAANHPRFIRQRPKVDNDAEADQRARTRHSI